MGARLLHFLVIAAPLLAFPACEEPEEEINAGNLKRQEVRARCEFLVRCGFAPDQGSCEAAAGPDWGLVQAVGVSNLGRVEYDPKAAQVYVEALSQRTCSSTEESAREITNLRADIFVGKIEVGDVCFASEECVGDAVCDTWACPGEQVCCTGRCVAKRVLATGDTCPLADSPELYYTECPLGTFCRPPPDDGSGVPPLAGICSPRVDNGQPCVSNGECLDGQRCGNGQCYKLSTAADPCNPMLQAGSCVDFNQACDPASSTCATAPGPGAACAQDQCIRLAVCIDGLCVARPRLGEPCDGSVPCLGDLYCGGDGFCEGTTVVFACLEGEDPPPPMGDTD